MRSMGWGRMKSLQANGAMDQLHQIETRPLDREAREIDVSDDLLGRPRLGRLFRDRRGAFHPKPRRFARDRRLAEARRLMGVSAAAGPAQVLAQQIEQLLHAAEMHGGETPCAAGKGGLTLVVAVAADDFGLLDREPREIDRSGRRGPHPMGGPAR